MVKKEGNERYIIPAVSTAVRLIQMLAESDSPLTLDRLCRETGEPRSTVHRVLVTLEHEGMVRRGEAGRGYRVTPKVLQLASAWGRGTDMVTEFTHVARRLVDEIDETSQLAILDRSDVVFIAKVDSNRAVRLVTEVGKRVPAYASAVGKALLAFVPYDVYEQVLKSGLVSLTENTVTDHSVLDNQLRRVRSEGVAEAIEESVRNLTCVASPVFNYTGEVVAAMSICVPEANVSQARRSFLKSKVIDSARSLSLALGSPASGTGQQLEA